MNDLNLPETTREITRAKIQLFKNQREFIASKNDPSEQEEIWMSWSGARIIDLEKEPA